MRLNLEEINSGSLNHLLIEDARMAHLAGEMAKAPKLFASDPNIQQIGVFATKELHVKEVY